MISNTIQKWAQDSQVELRFFSSVDSTNQEAKKEISPELSGLVLYVAETQTQGRGRSGRHWYNTAPGTNLLSSWSLSCSSAPQPIMGPLIGLALYRAAMAPWPQLPWSLKAPNDLFLGEKKVAGLLLETVSRGDLHRLIVGLGFNLLDHPQDLPEATHLSHSEGLGRSPSSEELTQFLSEFHQQLLQAVHQGLAPELIETARIELAKALNAHPLKPGYIVEVTPSASLILADKTLRWSDL